MITILLLMLHAAAATGPAVPGGDISDRHQEPSVRPSDLKELPDDLRDHFLKGGIRLRREVLYSGLKTEWVVVDPSSDGRCELRTSFVAFDADAPLAEIKRYLTGVSSPAQLNETARLAMFRPWWRGTTSEPRACDEYMARSRPTVEQLLAAFRAYAPRNRPDQTGRRRE